MVSFATLTLWPLVFDFSPVWCVFALFPLFSFASPNECSFCWIPPCISLVFQFPFLPHLLLCIIFLLSPPCPVVLVSLFSRWIICSLVSIMHSWVSFLSCSSLFHSRLPGPGFLTSNLSTYPFCSFSVVWYIGILRIICGGLCMLYLVRPNCCRIRQLFEFSSVSVVSYCLSVVWIVTVSLLMPHAVFAIGFLQKGHS